MMFLKEHPNLLVTKSDKGNTAVIMDRKDYTDKTMSLLQNPDDYDTILRDLLTGLQTRYNQLIKSFLADSSITK